MLWPPRCGCKEEALADLEKAYSEHFGFLTNLKSNRPRPAAQRPAVQDFIAPRRFST